jgi:DNA-binding YbaB/EbfC family protein
MFGDIGKMLKLVGEIKTKLPEMRQKLAESEFSAQAGGGAVRATVNGQLALVDVQIDKELLADGDAEMLEDSIKAAVSAAQAQAAKAAAEAMKELTGGMDIPGLEGLIG